MPILCVWVPAFRLAVARRTNTVSLDAPIIVADKIERGRVVDASLTAAALGVRAGMTLVQAQAIAHDATTVIDDPVLDATVWHEVLDALDAASPIVQDDGLGHALLDMQGIEGDAAGWFAAVRHALADCDLPLRLGLGPNPFVARAAATLGENVAAPRDASAFLAPLSLEVLECGDDIRERLRLLGITTLGALAALPNGPFVRRFGAAAQTWHDRARGIDPRMLRPRPRELRIDRTLYGEGEATSEEAVLFALRTLVARVVDDLAAAGKRAGRLTMTLECENGDRREVSTRVAQATAVQATLFELLRARLEGIVLESPVVGLRLTAEQLEDGGVALTLFSGSDPDPDALGIVLARIDAALGEGRALRPRVVDGPRAERRYALDPFTIEALQTKRWECTERAPLPAAATLQFRLLSAELIAVRILNGRPQSVGSPEATVIDSAGPWRVDEAWWAARTGSGTTLIRDEYDVLLEDGALIRIARTPDGTWSLCGRYD